MTLECPKSATQGWVAALGLTAFLVSLAIIRLDPTEAEGLAHLCHILDWEFLAEHSRIANQAVVARYALAKLRFALSDAGFSAMPDREPCPPIRR